MNPKLMIPLMVALGTGSLVAMVALFLTDRRGKVDGRLRGLKHGEPGPTAASTSTSMLGCVCPLSVSSIVTRTTEMMRRSPYSFSFHTGFTAATRPTTTRSAPR